MNLTLKIWRQKDAKSPGKMVTYPISNIEGHMSFLEMMDILNDELIEKQQKLIAQKYGIKLTNHSLYLYGEPVDGECKHK